jgi:hypothetical protein
MQTRLKIFGFILILFFSNCKKDNNSTSDFLYKAIVIGLNRDCFLYEIKILNGLEKVKTIAGISPIDSVYIAANLPDSLKVSGLNIQLDLRKPSNNELGACTTLGPAFTWIYVIKATSVSCFDYELYQQHKNDICPDDCIGVTGCDGKIYCNECYAARQGIRIKK